jgi:hypothetical protein
MVRRSGVELLFGSIAGLAPAAAHDAYRIWSQIWASMPGKRFK